VRIQGRCDAVAAAARQFLMQDDRVKSVRFHAAESFGKANLQHADLGRLAVELAWEGTRLVPGEGVRPDFLGDEPTQLFTERFVVLGVEKGTVRHVNVSAVGARGKGPPCLHFARSA